MSVGVMDHNTEDDQELQAHLALLSMDKDSKDRSSRSGRREEVNMTPLFSGSVKRAVEGGVYHPGAFRQYGLLAGRLYDDTDTEGRPKIGESEESGLEDESSPSRGEQTTDPRIFLNVQTPSSAFICGSQGSGKSHTLSCMLENCLLPSSQIGKLPNPLAGIVFHYDSFSSLSCSQVCEAAYLCSQGVPVRVLVSPSNQWAMKKLYSDISDLPTGCRKPEVVPLYLEQKHLTTARMMSLMAVSGGDGPVPLYVKTIVRILRAMAAENKGAPGVHYAAFTKRLDTEGFSRDQSGPLALRLDLLESFMNPDTPGLKTQGPNITSSKMTSSKGNPQRQQGVQKRQLTSDIWDFQPGTLTIVDLSCPFVDSDATCVLFEICLSIFLENRGNMGTVIALDEAHKVVIPPTPPKSFPPAPCCPASTKPPQNSLTTHQLVSKLSNNGQFMTLTASATQFTNFLLQTIRLQRHLATRVIIATQEPIISPKLLDLCSMTFVHRFTSPDWLRTLSAHLAGASDITSSHDESENDNRNRKNKMKSIFERIVNLDVGEALLFSPSALLCDGEDKEGGEEMRIIRNGKLASRYLKVRVRKRITADGGKSVLTI